MARESSTQIGVQGFGPSKDILTARRKRKIRSAINTALVGAGFVLGAAAVTDATTTVITHDSNISRLNADPNSSLYKIAANVAATEHLAVDAAVLAGLTLALSRRRR